MDSLLGVRVLAHAASAQVGGSLVGEGSLAAGGKGVAIRMGCSHGHPLWQVFAVPRISLVTASDPLVTCFLLRYRESRPSRICVGGPMCSTTCRCRQRASRTRRSPSWASRRRRPRRWPRSRASPSALSRRRSRPTPRCEGREFASERLSAECVTRGDRSPFYCIFFPSVVEEMGAACLRKYCKQHLTPSPPFSPAPCRRWRRRRARAWPR